MHYILGVLYCTVVLAIKIPLSIPIHLISLCFSKERTPPNLRQRIFGTIIRTTTSTLPTWLLRKSTNSSVVVQHFIHGLYREKQRKKWVKKLDATIERDGWEGYLIAIDAENTEIGEDADKVILYAHGGAFVMGSALSCLVGYIEWIKAWKLSRDVNAHILSLEYGLSPENSFPVAKDNMLKCYQWLVNVKGISPSKIVFAGDSAGGNLAIVSALHLSDQSYDYSVEPPSGLLLISPFVSWLTTAESYSKNASYDMVNASWLHDCAEAYIGDSNLLPSCSLVSPLFENRLSSLPKVWVCVGSYEVFYDDITLFVEKLLQNNVKANLVIEENNLHVYAVVKLLSRNGAFERSIKQMGDFLFDVETQETEEISYD